MGLSHSEALSTCPNHPWPGAKQLRTALTLQSPLKFLKPTNPKPAYPASPVSPYSNHNKGFCPHFLPLMTDPGASPYGPAW